MLNMKSMKNLKNIFIKIFVMKKIKKINNKRRKKNYKIIDLLHIDSKLYFRVYKERTFEKIKNILLKYSRKIYEDTNFIILRLNVKD